MRQDILDFLIQHKDEFVSGQQISEQLGISRTAVWKHIRVLKQRGYVIESYTKKGYCLREAPELLSEQAIEEGLSTKVVGRHIVYRERVDSTNNVAKKLADEGAPEGTIVVAEEQTGGRGRINRSFLSPFAKGVWFSLILRPNIPPMEVSKMTLLAAVAVARAIRHHGLTDCGIKWPNDILVKGRKMVGILTLNAEAGAGFVAFSPLAQGLLTDRYLNGIPEGSRMATEGSLRRDVLTDRMSERIRGLHEIARQRGQTLAEMALAWLLRDKRVTSVIIGASSVAQIEDNLRALEHASFTDDELSRLDALSRP